MFFIFGTSNKTKQITTYNNFICLSCGSLSHLTIVKVYSYFHLFFIPLFKWNLHYFATASCCGTIFEINAEKGRQFEKGENVILANEDLNMVSNKSNYQNCPYCSAPLSPGFTFCPRCGRRL